MRWLFNALLESARLAKDVSRVLFRALILILKGLLYGACALALSLLGCYFLFLIVNMYIPEGMARQVILTAVAGPLEVVGVLILLFHLSWGRVLGLFILAILMWLGVAYWVNYDIRFLRRYIPFIYAA